MHTRCQFIVYFIYAIVQVRAAAVFALGTYVSCDKERSDHALNVDQSIAVTLLNQVAKDMSPMVREVIL